MSIVEQRPSRRIFLTRCAALIAAAGAPQVGAHENGPDRNGPDKSDPDKNDPDKNGPDKNGPDKNGPDKNGPPAIGLGFSLYGMRSMKLTAAIKLCGAIGYDCVELPLMPDWPGDSAKWSAARTGQVRRVLDEQGLRLNAFMENLPLSFEAAGGARNLDRLKRAGQVAGELTNDGATPVIETILGGRPADWNQLRAKMAARLQEWARVAEASQTIIAIKAHVGGAMHLPEHPLQLARQVGSPWLRCAYDYSHFQLAGVDLHASMQRLLPATVFIHVKDARGDTRNVKFLLPGEGKIDYVDYLKTVGEFGYRGDIHVEVSGQIHGRPDYDPAAAARQSYAHLAKAFQAAGTSRR